MSDADTAQTWATAINDVLTNAQQNQSDSIYDDGGAAESAEVGRGGMVCGPGRRLLVLINPVSGTGNSRSAWEKTLRLVARVGLWLLVGGYAGGAVGSVSSAFDLGVFYRL